ncbi:MAG TPA: response regulator transcription factor [Candidatus Polarisedimenticolaceae bacterium]
MSERSRPLRILLVDDNEIFLTAAGGWLSRQPGLDLVATAGDGEEALAVLPTAKPDLVVMDTFMPGIGGLEATRLIKSAPGAPYVVMVSVHEGPAIEREAWAAGADGFVTKAELYAHLPALIQELFATKPPSRGVSRSKSSAIQGEQGGQ